ncbi:FAD-dependent oxidoreductase [Streptococcus didelphis]|uniref:FAD-dependent oxidoreductase n=1 Tax=Streptococcus didelphis TaxID=102886 RepID=A0ABY9LIX4_9STRE|nr:FAD-dependent oxidoreductase [Streptococcus didelphis]
MNLVEAADYPDFHQTDSDMIGPLLDEIKTSSVKLLRRQRVNEIEEVDQKVLVKTDKGTCLRGDLAILAVNFRPNSHLLENQVVCNLDKTVKVNQYMQTSKADIFAIGDLVSLELAGMGMTYHTSLINQAIKTGQVLAYHLSGIKTPPLKTVKIVGSFHFGYYRSSLGLTKDEADLYEDAFSFLYKSYTDRQKKQLLWIKLIASQKDGRLIGAQLISKENNLLLANQLAQALQYQLTVQDLAFQDFIYSKNECELGYHLHQACLQAFEKRMSYEN